MDEPVISIGVLAQKVGLSVSAVRRYENEGLVIAHRTAAGRRLFSHEDISRVRNTHHMIQDLGLNIEGIRRMQALLPCWELRPCSTANRGSCPAYDDGTQPCWRLRGLQGCPQESSCRRCGVYRFGSLGTQDIKRLLHEQDDPQGAGEAIRELLRRLRDSRQEGS